jgi:two-component system phosphate regulon sensor histidine kinase PhoR
LVGLFIAVVAYLAMWSISLVLVNRWISQPKRHDIPAGFGLWGAVFTNIKRLKKRAKKRERFLKRRLAEYQAPALALPDATIALNQLGEIRWMNAAAEDLFDLHGKSDVGEVFVNLVRLPELVDYLRQVITHKIYKLLLPGVHEKTLLIRVANVWKRAVSALSSGYFISYSC